MSMGSRLSDLRKRNGLTRKELAEKLNMPETTLRNYELGTREPGHTFLIQIATLFDVTVDYLLELTDSEHGIYSASPTITHMPTSNPLTPDEDELITLYRSVNEDGQYHIRETAKMVAGNPAMKKERIEKAT